MKVFFPQDQVYWYLKYGTIPSLNQTIKTDVVIVGGGVAGLSAAQAFLEKGLNVVLLEKSYCGAGASGKSSGFITPDSELSLSDLATLYGQSAALDLWKLVTSGVDLIRKNIVSFNLECDYRVQDTLVVANSKSDFLNDIKKEYDFRIANNYKANLYNAANLLEVINSKKYYGGVSYPDTFGIDVYEYCQSLKNVLSQKGVKIFEESPVVKINTNGVETANAKVIADYVIVCTDQFLPNLDKLTSEIYHAQTFLMVSSKLSDKEVKSIFPDRNYMVWDTDLIYQYFRITGDNRLLLGGASLFYTYAKYEIHQSMYIFKKLNNYFKKKFPHLKINFEYIWPGLIGITKDILPIAGRDKKRSNIYYISGCAGLPWASALGFYSAEQLLNNNNEYDHYLSPYRKFFLGPIAQKILGTRLTFAICNVLRTKKIY